MKTSIILGCVLVLSTVLGTARPSAVDAQPLPAREITVKQLNPVTEIKISEPTSSGKIKPEPIKSVSVPVSGAKAFIYSHESGNNPGAINASSGACGLGQALPCSKMPCSLSDYACQDNFFTQYMQSRYGTWENAVAFWQSHRWW